MKTTTESSVAFIRTGSIVSDCDTVLIHSLCQRVGMRKFHGRVSTDPNTHRCTQKNVHTYAHNTLPLLGFKSLQTWPHLNPQIFHKCTYILKQSSVLLCIHKNRTMLTLNCIGKLHGNVWVVNQPTRHHKLCQS